VATPPPVELTFFCELDGAALEALFADPVLLDRLRALGARVSLGILDFSAQRAGVVRQLNRAGIPVIAWQLLPRAQGYWCHSGNPGLARKRYRAFLAWTRSEGLEWSGVGVDIEPPIAELEQLLTSPLGFLRTALRRGCGRRRHESARRAYEALVTEMRANGFAVHSYEFPFICDEARLGSSLLQRLLGITALTSDQRVVLLYSSFFRPFGDALLWLYAQNADAVGVGSTGGGVELRGVSEPIPLNWEELRWNLAIARRWSHHIHIFSLEGCLRQGFLERLQQHDWGCPARRPLPWTPVVATVRRFMQAGLWLAARPWLTVTLVGGGIALWALL